MIQSDQMGQFNKDIRDYNYFIARSITATANDLRDSLLDISRDKDFYDTQDYIEQVVEGYRQFVHMIFSLHYPHSVYMMKD